MDNDTSLFELRLHLFGQPRLLKAPEEIEQKQRERNNRKQPGDLPVAPLVDLTQPVKIGRRKSLALLAYLVMNRKVSQRQNLMTLLWPDTKAKLAYSYLRRELAVLRSALSADWLVIDRDSVELRARSGLWLDVAEFRRLLRETGQHGHPIADVCPRCVPLLDDAAALYTEDFLSGFSFRDSPNFDEWRFFEAEQLRSDMVGVLARLVQGYTARGEFQQAIAYVRRCLEYLPWHEPSHRDLMKLYVWTGNEAAALHQFDVCVAVLDGEMGQPPEDATIDLYEAVRAHRVPPPQLWQDYQPPNALARSAEEIGAAPGSGKPLPTQDEAAPWMVPQVTEFIGRSNELAEIERLLKQEPACRLLTIVGPGGVGKTRLALAAADGVRDHFEYGTTVVYLDTIDSVPLLIQSIATALDYVFPQEAAPKRQLFDYLRSKNLLLVLDNFEQLLKEADSAGTGFGPESHSTTFLLELMAVAPALKILITSTERLNIHAEWVQPLRGLKVPPLVASAPHNADAPAWEEYGAVELFLHHARRIKPYGQLTPADRAAITRICHAVEGMPLALELAASWWRVMSFPEIAEEFSQDLSSLFTSMRDMPERHRSLTALFDNSWRLLSPREQSTISKLAVFRGGFDRAAAASVAAADVDQLAALIDKSMLRSEAAGRYQIPEILRQCALDYLEGAQAIHARHSRYYAQFLQNREDRLLTGERQQVAKEIRREIDNIRAAWDWASEHYQWDAVDRGLGCLHQFYVAQEWTVEGEVAFAHALSSLASSRPPAVASAPEQEHIRGRLLVRRGHLTYRLGRYARSVGMLRESLEIFERLNEHSNGIYAREKAFALICLGATWRKLGDLAQAEALCQSSLALYEALDDVYGQAGALQQLAILAAQQAQYDEAQLRFQSARDLFEQVNNVAGVADVLSNLGVVADHLGDLDTARRRHWQCLHMRRQIGDRRGISISLNNLGYLEYRRAHYHMAMSFLTECFEIQKDLGERDLIANCLSNLGATATALGELAAAADYYEQALALAAALSDDALVKELLAGMVVLKLAESPPNVELAALIWRFVTNRGTTSPVTLPPAAMSAESKRLLEDTVETTEATLHQQMTLNQVLQRIAEDRMLPPADEA